jgi:hypothetical protein
MKYKRSSLSCHRGNDIEKSFVALIESVPHLQLSDMTYFVAFAYLLPSTLA